MYYLTKVTKSIIAKIQRVVLVRNILTRNWLLGPLDNIFKSKISSPEVPKW